MSTFNSQSTSSSEASRRFRLDENDGKEIFVYKVRCGLEFTTQAALCKQLDQEQKYRCSRKPIPRGTSHLDIKMRDLLNEPERTEYADYPNQGDSLASVGLPPKVFWRRFFLGHFPEMYIVSPESSPAGSQYSSGPSSSNSPVDTSNAPSRSATFDTAAP